ncbi:hypothetical protein AAKU55_003172 [Oxalobacteraceae bacterium GrIS 1.11]
MSARQPHELLLAASAPTTMSSMDIVNVINAEREPGSAELAHADFMKRVKAHPGIDAGKFSGVYLGGNGQQRPCYHLPKREAELMVMSESLKVQTRVYDRLAAIESGALPAPIRAAHKKDESGLPAMRQAKALQMNIESAKALCAIFPDLGAQAQQTIFSKLIGADVVPLPAVGRLYSATEIGAKYNASPNAVGRLAIANDLKVEKYGQYVLDKSQSSNKQMSNFLYNAVGVARIGELLGSTAKKAPPSVQSKLDIE